MTGYRHDMSGFIPFTIKDRNASTANAVIRKAFVRQPCRFNQSGHQGLNLIFAHALIGVPDFITPVDILLRVLPETRVLWVQTSNVEFKHLNWTQGCTYSKNDPKKI